MDENLESKMQVVRMPKMGQTMETGTVVEWRLGEGDSIDEDEVVVIVESEKASNEVTASQSGTLARIDVKEGEEVPPGTVIGVVLGPDESLDDAPPPRSESGAGADSADEESDSEADAVDSEIGTKKESVEAGIEDSMGSSSSEPSSARHFATPSTRRLARELGVSIDELSGRGIGDRITRQDVLAAAGQGVATPVSNQSPGGDRAVAESETNRSSQIQDSDVTITERRELSGTRRTIAERMVESHTSAPHVTLNREVVVDSALAVAEELSEGRDVNVGFNDVLVVAVARALREHPRFNAWFNDDTLHLIDEVNIAVAVDTDEGLITPVVRNVDQRTVGDISWERRRITDKVLEGTHTMDELQGGTFTITNLGMFGVTSFDPIINPPQVAILGVGRFSDTEHGTECTLSLSFDHRVVDGADAARFLESVVSGIESPSRLIVDQITRAERGVQRESGVTETVAPPAEAGVERSDARPKRPDIDRSIAAAIESRIPDLAAEYEWSVTDCSVAVSAEDGLTVIVEPEADISEATLRRVTYAACRDVGHEFALEDLFDPTLSISRPDTP